MSDAVLEVINTTIRDRFELGWRRGTPETIEALLPDPDAQGYLPTLEELVRIDLESAWRTKGAAETVAAPTVDSYVARFPALREKNRLARLLRYEFDARTRAGETLGPDDITRRFPELDAATVDQALLTTVGPHGDETIVEPLWAPAQQLALGKFGDYELLSKLGEGGMGVVYRARQTGANRVVALKVVHSAHAGSGREGSKAKVLERFRIEAQAAAQLVHDNIVPVYDVGQVGDHLYFSMRLVDGHSLNDLVRKGPLEGKAAARYVAGAARGVAQAHRQGILHRDLKPHNVMVDKASDRPLVADFGLAKVVEADDQVTRSGEVIGTPSYMPPEQVASAATVDHRADVYALGATLYHLVSGKPPFQAANTLATIRQVLYQEAAAPEQLNAAIDRDLSTICVKCLQKEPGKRYATADELADDLDRYLKGEPIVARPIGRGERTVRWCKRNPLPAALTGLAAGLAVAVFAATVIGYRSTTKALGKAERNFQVARESIDELYTDVSEIDLENAPGMQPLKEKLLTRSLAYYERLLAEADDAAVTADFAENHFRAGVILDQLGRPDEAGPHFAEAETIQSQLLAANPKNKELRLALSNTYNEQGRLHQRRGELGDAATAFGDAETLRADLVKEFPDDLECRRKLANIRMNLGLLAAKQGDPAAAAKLYQNSQGERAELLEKDPKSAPVREDVAKGRFNEGTLALGQKDLAGAVQGLSAAVAGFEALLADKPESIKYRFRLAMAQSLLADALEQNRQIEKSRDVFAAARANLQVLVDENPLVDQFQNQLTTLQLGEAQQAIRVGRQTAAAGLAAEGAERESTLARSQKLYEEAERILGEARVRLERLVARDPQATSLRHDLAVAQQMLGDVQLAFGDKAAAKAQLTAARDVAAALPAGPQRDKLLGEIEANLAPLVGATGPEADSSSGADAE